MNFLDDLSYPNPYKHIGIIYVEQDAYQRWGPCKAFFIWPGRVNKGIVDWKQTNKQTKRKGKEKQKEEPSYFFSQSMKIPMLKTPATWYLLNKYLWLN